MPQLFLELLSGNSLCYEILETFAAGNDARDLADEDAENSNGMGGRGELLLDRSRDSQVRSKALGYLLDNEGCASATSGGCSCLAWKLADLGFDGEKFAGCLGERVAEADGSMLQEFGP